MKYLPIKKSLFIQNRKRFVKHLRPGSVAVFNSNDIMPTSADGTRSFIQHTDIFYMSGIDQEETILLLCPGAAEQKHREILFVKETNERIALWEGHKLSKEAASKISGIQTVYWTSEFDTIFRLMAFESERIYLNTNEHLRGGPDIETKDVRFVKWCQSAFPLHKYERIAPIMHELRAIKSRTETELIRRACDITEKAFRRVLGFVRPGVWEYEIEAEICHEFLKNRARPAYESIVASGDNSCVLHYTQNNRRCKKGDILLMDFGASYANYASDLSRSVPVSGRFTQRQKAVYNAVLRVQKAAIQMLKPGNTIEEYHKQVGKIMEKELIGLRLLKASEVKKQDKNKPPLYKKYFMHGTSHYLGLDVHDYGSRHRKFEAGMVFTCEPGIYIPEESLGIRIENDIWITDEGPDDLTKRIPIEAEDIEELMNA